MAETNIDYKKILGVGSLGGPTLLNSWVEDDGVRIGVFAREKTGKSHFALTAPPPIILFDVGEHNHGELLKSMRKQNLKDEPILAGTYMIPPPGENSTSEAIARKFINDYHHIWLEKLYKNKIKATIVIDSGTMLWELFKNGLVPSMKGDGKGKSRDYGEANSSYYALFSQAKYYGQRLIVTARTSQVWVDNAPTDKWNADWQKFTPNHCDITLEIKKSLVMGADGKTNAQRLYTVTSCVANKDLERNGPINNESWPEMDYEQLMGLVENYER